MSDDEPDPERVAKWLPQLQATKLKLHAQLLLLRNVAIRLGLIEATAWLDERITESSSQLGIVRDET